MGVLSGFDRLVLRGYIRQLGYVDGMSCYMAVNRVRSVDLKNHVVEVTGRLRQAVEEPVRHFTGDARNKLTERTEGIRISHTAKGNSIKVYDKAYAQGPRDWSVLRVETTTTNPSRQALAAMLAA